MSSYFCVINKVDRHNIVFIQSWYFYHTNFYQNQKLPIIPNLVNFAHLQIFTPDGVSIRFDGHLYWWSGRPYYANVYIQTTSDYRDKTFGMCGNNNDDVEDDHMKQNGEKLESHYNIVASELYTAEWKYDIA